MIYKRETEAQQHTPPLSKSSYLGQGLALCLPIFWGLEIRILVHYPAHLSICLCSKNFQVQTPSSLQLRSLTFQADCGSIKSAGIPTEEGTEHQAPLRPIFPAGE